MQFIISSDTVKIKIEALSRKYPNDLNIAERNWIHSKLNIEIPGYTVLFNSVFRIDELNHFYKQLKSMDKKLKGTAGFTMIDGYVEIESDINLLGEINWSVETCYPVEEGAILRFNFMSDQSYLKDMIRDIEDILLNFSVIKKN